MRLSAGRGRVPAALAVVVALGWCTAVTTTATATAATAPPAAQQRAEPLARLDLDTMAPRVVTTAGPGDLVVTGEVVNTGDRTLSDLGVRLQRDPALSGSDATRAALDATPEAAFVTEFVALAGELEPGERQSFRIAVPVGTGPDQQALQITDPGVYPLLVNLNGTPEFGGVTRLAAVPLLLPVLGVPSPEPGEPAEPFLIPTALTVLWPLVAEPTRLLSGPGEPLLLAGRRAGTDPLAEELAPGGRLDGLLGALEEVVVPGSPLAGGLCVVVDPALLDTVDAMTAGYRVAGPAGLEDGTGAEDAQRWLGRLRATVAGRCVLPLPYGDPDIVALSRAGLTDLEALATSTGTRLAGELLAVAPLTGLVWPVDGVLDERTLGDLQELTAPGSLAVLLEARGLTAPPLESGAATLPGGSRALVVDPLLSTALAPAAPRALTGTAAISTRPAGTGEPLAAQDGIGVLTQRALAEESGPVLLVPPRRWQVNQGEAAVLLRAATQLVTAGYFAPRDLPGTVVASGGPPTALDYPVQAGAREIPPGVTEQAGRTRDVLRDLQVATERDATVDLEPAALLDALRFGLLRAVSTAWRDEPMRAAELMAGVTSRLDDLQRAVRIAAPPGSYTLASSDSPLLVTVENELPVSVEVRLDLEQVPGLRTGVVGVQQIPARSGRQFVIPAEVSRVGQFSVGARLTTPGGTPLGRPTTLQLQSTALRTVTVALTVGAAAVLVLLVGRRLVRRVKAARAGEALG
ncbi:MAG: DUF6049 family protein [Pseudonocardiaceae bacterium]